MTSLGDVVQGRVAGGIRRYRGERVPVTVAAAAGAAGRRAAVVDCSRAVTRDDVIAAFADALGWPAWVGRSWDAFEEALGDAASSYPQPLVLVLLGGDEYARADPGGWRTLLSIMRDAVEEARTLQVLLWAPSVDPGAVAD